MKVLPLSLLPALLLCQPPVVPQDKDKAGFEGQVFNAVTGEPLRKARISLRMNVASTPATRQPFQPGQPQPQAPQSPAVTVVSDATGKFEFVNLEPGNYQLTARRDGFQDAQYGSRSSGKLNEAILLAAGDRKTAFQVKMTPYGVIAGRLVDEDGDPVRSVRVAAMSYQYTNTGRELIENRTSSTDDIGQYRLFDLPPGKYYLKAAPQQMRINRSSDDSESFAPAFYPGVAEPANAAPLELAAGQQLAGLALTMRRARYATIRGRVVAPPGATTGVGLMIVSGNSTSSTNTNIEDKEGKFELFGVGPGQIYLTGSYSLAGQRFTTQLPLQVGSSDINGIELRPAPSLEVSGQVRIDGVTTAKPSQVQVMLQGPGRGYGYETGTVKDDGSMLLRDVVPNVYRINVSNLRDLYLKSVHWGPTDITDSTLDLSAGVPPRTELAVVIGADSGQIEGTVKNDESEPVDSAVVTLVPGGSRPYPFYFKNATTDAAGHFMCRGVAPGTYKIYAWEKVDPNTVKFDPDFLKPYEAAGQNLQVQPSDKQNLDLKLIVTRTQP